MPRTPHAEIKVDIWQNPDFRSLGPAAQWLYFRLVADPSRNHAGVVALTLKRWAGSSAGVTQEFVQAALDELSSDRFVIVDHETEEVLIRTYIRHNDVARQPNVLKAALRAARAIESPLLRSALAVELRMLPPKPADTATMVYPDPHACADEIEPADRLRSVPSRRSEPQATTPTNPSAKGSEKGSENPRGNPGERESSKKYPVENFAREDVDHGRATTALAVQPPLMAEVHAEPPRPDVEALCDRLLAKLVETDYKPLPKVTKVWRDQARLLLDKDERNVDQALRLIDWALENDFWSTNIASMGKFRTQYPKLLAAAKREHAARKGTAPPTIRSQRLEATAAMVARFRAEEEAESNAVGITNFARKALEG